jgi:hypothetical protein
MQEEAARWDALREWRDVHEWDVHPDCADRVLTIQSPEHGTNQDRVVNLPKWARCGSMGTMASVSNPLESRTALTRIAKGGHRTLVSAFGGA